MLPFSNISHIYFIGIGGIGMSALARYFAAQGIQVAGYDKTPTPLTAALTAEGINIHFEDDINQLPEHIDMVVYTPAIPANHSELNYLREKGYKIYKRSEVLGKISEGKYTIAIAGTHGKTSITAMVAFVLNYCKVNCTALIGGIARNFNSNFMGGNDAVMVLEADEYDRSFLRLHPNIAVITACDDDHLDIYGTGAAMRDAFEAFTANIVEGGTLIIKKNLPLQVRAERVYTYHLDDVQSNYYVSNINIEDGVYHYQIHSEHLPDATYCGATAALLRIGGIHNIENSVAVWAVAQQLSLPADQVIAAIAAFQGIKRRFEYIRRSEDLVVIDDYAHHPAEISMLLKSVRALYPAQTIRVIFQPHLYSRTRDLAQGFADSLALADEVYLLPIYPAREIAISGITSEWLANMLPNCKGVINKIQAREMMLHTPKGIWCTVGAGDIDQILDIYFKCN